MEMDIFNPFVPACKKQNRIPSSEVLAEISPVRLNILFACLSAAQSFFSSFLSIPASSYRLLSIVDWSRLIYATVIIYKLSLGSPRIPEWDVQAARTTANLECYLETLCQRMQSISSTGPGVPEGADLFSIMKLIFDNVKSTYVRLRDDPRYANPREHEDENVHETSFPTKKPLHGGRRYPASRCPAFPYLNKQGQKSPADGQDQHGESLEELLGADPFATGAEFPDGYDCWTQMMADTAAFGAGGGHPGF